MPGSYRARATNLSPILGSAARYSDIVGDSEEAAARAAFHGDTAALRELLSQGADPDGTDEDGSPLIELAVRGDHVEAVRALADFGADLDVASLIHNVAASRDLPDMLPVLLDLGADPSRRDERGWTPLHFAAAHGYAGSAAILLDNGADPDARTPEGLKPSDLAQRNGHTDLASSLTQSC
jgi:ankyrin repeat protein